MPQWEHICVLGGEDTVSDQAGSEVSIQVYLNQMGQSGWELVAVTPRAGGGSAELRFSYWLKRQCQERPRPPSKPERPQIEPLPAVLSPSSDDEDDLVGGFAFGYPPMG